MATKKHSGAAPAAPAKDITDRVELSTAQYKTVLEQIAEQANTLRQLLVLGNQDPGAWTAGVIISSARDLAVTIGAMADKAAGSSIIGDVDDWFYGPNFAAEGKEASHG